MPATFIQIPIELIDYINQRKLTGLQYRLWLYLYSKDPFGDRYIKIPSPEQIAIEFGVCARSIQRAAQRLVDLDLFDFIVDSWSAKNTTTNLTTKNSARTKRSKNGQKDPDLAKETKRSKNGQKDPDLAPKANQGQGYDSSQTLQNSNTLSDLEGEEKTEIELFNQNIELQDPWFEDDTNNSTLAEIKNCDEGSSAAELELIDKNKRSNITEAEVVPQRRVPQAGRDLPTVTRKDKLGEVSQIDPKQAELTNYYQTSPNLLPSHRVTGQWSMANGQWLIPGPWLMDGQLDPNFTGWLANDWINRYGGTIHQRRADVLSHFKKDPANLPIRWQQYQSEYLDRFRNAQMRSRSGIEIKPTEQQHLLQHTGAITRPLPPSLSPTSDNQSGTLQVSDRPTSQKNLPLTPSSINNNSDLHHNNSNSPQDEISENQSAYQLYQPRAIDNPAKKDDVKQFFSKLGKAFKMKKSPTPVSDDGNKLAQLNAWLLDPILYPEALKRAKSAGYAIDYNENGVALNIFEPDF